MSTRRLRVVSWNVNGLRACARKGFADWLHAERAEVVGLQEVRALPAEVEPALHAGWQVEWAPAERRGYSGVALWSRRKPDAVAHGLGVPRFDVEGRFVLARFGRLVVANGYFPKGSGALRDNARVPYKLAFYHAVFERLARLRRAGWRVLALGDLNTAHREIDLAHPRANRRTSGFLPEERAELDRWIRAGWVDCFRAFHPEPGHYTWWSQRHALRNGGARARNVGWRIDYVLASPAAMRFVRAAFHRPGVLGSDHCPVGVDLDPAVLG